MDKGKSKKTEYNIATNVINLPDLKFITSSSPNIKIVRELYTPSGTTAVAYTDDLTMIAAGQENGNIILFDKNSEPKDMCDYEMSLTKEPCTDIKVKPSPRGGYHKTLLASYFSGHIKLWDSCIRKPLYTLKENRQTYALRYHLKLNKFVTVGNDFKVNLYDEETRVTERVLASSGVKGNKNGHNESVCSAIFHPKNMFEIVSGGVDSTIQFWDTRVPYSVRCIEGVQMFGDGLDISRDGKLVLCTVSNSKDSYTQIYDYNTGKLLKFFSKPGCFSYCCRFLSPAYIGIGGFFQHTLRIVNMYTLQVHGAVTGLQSAVASMALCKKLPEYKNPDTLPMMVIACGDRVLELEITTPEDIDLTTDVFYENENETELENESENEDENFSVGEDSEK